MTNKQFKIISDGTTDRTILIGPDGKAVGMCNHLMWTASSDRTTTELTVTLMNVPIEVIVPEENVVIKYQDIKPVLERAEQFAEIQQKETLARSTDKK